MDTAMDTDMASITESLMRHNRRRSRKATPAVGGLSNKRKLWIGCISVAGIFVASNATLAALAEVARTRDPALVTRVTADPIAPLLLLQRQAVNEPRRIFDKAILIEARKSLRYQAINTAPLRLLAIRGQALKDSSALTFAHLSERVTRRDLMTQLVLIEEAVRLDDHDLALRHYDKALRTSGEARTVLFPILSKALKDDVILDALIPYVRTRANWMPEFIQYALRDGPTGPRGTAELLVRAGAGRQADLMEPVAATLIGTLLEQGEFALARQLFLQLPGTSARHFEQAGFDVATTNPFYGPFAWTPRTDALAGASFEGSPDQDQRTARIFASTGERQVALRRMLALRPGQYRHSETRSKVAGDDTSRAYWEMKCPTRTGFEPIWRASIDRSSYNVAGAKGPLVPTDCPYQLLELTAVGGDSPGGLEATIAAFDLKH